MSVPKDVEAKFKRVNKQVAHLDKARPFGASRIKVHKKALTGAIEWLEKKHRTFIEKCDSAKKVGWKEDLANLPASVSTDSSGQSASSMPTALDTVPCNVDTFGHDAVLIVRTEAPR